LGRGDGGFHVRRGSAGPRIGRFFLRQSALYFAGSLNAGLGPGPFVATVLSKID